MDDGLRRDDRGDPALSPQSAPLRFIGRLKAWAAASAASDLRLPALRRILLVAGGLLYLAYALVTPAFQTPDEHQHLFRAYQLAHGQLHGEKRGPESGGVLPDGLVEAAAAEVGSPAPHVETRPVPRRKLSDIFARHTPVADDQAGHYANFLGAVLYAPAGYGPQMLAIRVGTGLDWSVENIVRLGRILNAALTLGLFYIALSILPVGRLFLLLLALMPMTAASSASLGQDGLVLGACAMLLALAVRARVEGRWTSGGLIMLGLFGTVLALSKIVYLPLLGIALFPRPLGARALPWFGWPVLLGLIAALFSALWVVSNAQAVVPMKAGMPAPAAQLAYVLGHPLDYLLTLLRTAMFRSVPTFLSTFMFGWMTIGPVVSAAWLASLSILLAVAGSDPAAPALRGLWRRWALLLILVVSLAVVTAIYLAGSPLGALQILGLQGRYFLPLLPLACLAVMPRQPLLGRGRLWLALTPMIAANLAVLAAIANAFYD
jgi:hypothetical protein